MDFLQGTVPLGRGSPGSTANGSWGLDRGKSESLTGPLDIIRPGSRRDVSDRFRVGAETHPLHKKCRAGTLTQRRTCPARMEASWGLKTPRATRSRTRPTLHQLTHAMPVPIAPAPLLCGSISGTESAGVLFVTQLSVPLDRGTGALRAR